MSPIDLLVLKIIAMRKQLEELYEQAVAVQSAEVERLTDTEEEQA